jgi:hypothetical protein
MAVQSPHCKAEVCPGRSGRRETLRTARAQLRETGVQQGIPAILDRENAGPSGQVANPEIRRSGSPAPDHFSAAKLMRPFSVTSFKNIANPHTINKLAPFLQFWKTRFRRSPCYCLGQGKHHVRGPGLI